MKRYLWASLVASALAVVVGQHGALAQGSGRAGQPAKPAAAARPAPPRAWYQLTVVTVKGDMLNEWIDFQKTQTMPMQQRGGIKTRDVWQSGAPFGDAYTYGIVTPLDNFVTFDSPPMALRVLGADAGRTYQEKIRRFVDHQTTYAVQTRPELSVAPKATMTPKFAILTDVTIVNGHADDYEGYIKNDLLPVLKRGKVAGYAVSRTTFGGNANEYHTVQYVDSFAEIDKGPLTRRVLGDAAAQALAAKSAPFIASTNRTILRYVPDLSFRPVTSTDNR